MKTLPISKETEDLFNRLQYLYDDRELLTSADEKSCNRRSIITLESQLDDHCSTEYNLPWFRLYSQWAVSNHHYFPDLLV